MSAEPAPSWWSDHARRARAALSAWRAGQAETALWGLLGLSFLSTTLGLLGISQANSARGLWAAGLVVFAVAVVTLLMKLMLDLAGDRRAAPIRALALAAYGVLMVWSVGFGYAFYWSVLAAKASTRATMVESVEAFQASGQDTIAALAAARGAVVFAADHTAREADRERAEGGTCGDGSDAGAGPRTRERARLAEDLGTIAGQITAVGVAPLEDAIRTAALDAETMLDQAAALDGDARRDFVVRHHRIQEQTATAINTDLAKLQASWPPRLAAFQDQVSRRPGESGFVCYDPALAALLDEAVGALRAAPPVAVGAFSFDEGADGAKSAFVELVGALPVITRNAGAALVPGGDAPPERVGLAKEEWIALAAAMIIDLFILLLGLMRPRDKVGGIWRALEVSTARREDIRAALAETIPRDPAALRELYERYVVRGRLNHYLVAADWGTHGDYALKRDRADVEALQLILVVAKIAAPALWTPWRLSSARIRAELAARVGAEGPPQALHGVRLSPQAAYHFFRLLDGRTTATHPVEAAAAPQARPAHPVGGGVDPTPQSPRPANDTRREPRQSLTTLDGHARRRMAQRFWRGFAEKDEG